jgi:hypothetical protein
MHRVELKLEADIRSPYADDESIDELDTVLATLVAGLPSEICRRDARVAGKAIHTARLPVTWVAGIDDHDAVQVATKPKRGRQTCGTSADYRDVIGLVHAG